MGFLWHFLAYNKVRKGDEIMIVLARQQSETQKTLEALLRRLPVSHNEYAYFQEWHRRLSAGFAGEQRVDREWLEINLPQPHYFLHDVQITNHFGTTHQIDTIFICSYFVVVLEIKNIVGHLDYDAGFHQFKRTTVEGNVEGMTDPFHQVKRHAELLERLIEQLQIEIPVKYAVVFATKNAILSRSLRNQPVFHVSGLRYQIRVWLEQYSMVKVYDEVLHKFMEKLLALHKPMKRDFAFPVQDIIPGVLCPYCGYKQKMQYHYKKWSCVHCEIVDERAILVALEDYRLLVDNKMTNKSFCAFFDIRSPNIAYKILQQLPLRATGTKRHRKYWIT